MHTLHAAPLLVVVLSLAACDDLIGDDFISEYDDHCSAAGTEADVAGAWSLTGRGERSECSVDALNTESFDIESVGLLDILQEDAALRLANDRGDFELRGSVDGICVSFTTTEVSHDISYSWSGTADNNTITGTFTGYGPEGCVSTGDFTVIID